MAVMMVIIIKVGKSVWGKKENGIINYQPDGKWKKIYISVSQSSQALKCHISSATQRHLV